MKNQINSFSNTLIGWHKDVSAIYLKQQYQIAKNSKYFTFEIMADESTCGECKIFIIYFMYWDSKVNISKIILLELKNLNQYTEAVISYIVTESYK